MTVRARASVLVGGALLVAGLSGTAARAVGGETACAGRTGVGTVSASVVQVGGTAVFSACGFAPGAAVAIGVNGVGVGSTRAGSDGAFSVPLKFSTPGGKSLTGTGAEPADSAAAAGSSPVTGAVLVGGTRVATGSVLVVGGAATAAGGSPAGDDTFGLPFSGAQTALLAVVALGLVGGGASLVLITRRRRSGDAASS